MIALPFSANRQPELAGERVYLRHPSFVDHHEWARLRADSRDFLTRWEPTWPPDDLGRQAYKARVRRYQNDIQEGVGYPFFIFSQSERRLLGGVTLGNVRRGVAQSAQIGYWLGHQHAGRGLMLDALGLIIPFAFDGLRLHRLEAACIPENTRSIRLLEKAGFAREGLLQSYLKINGQWRDHLLFSRIEDGDAG